MPPKLSFGGMCGNLQVIPLDNPRMKLLSDTELLLCDYGTVAVDILADQIVEKTTTLTYQSLKSSCPYRTSQRFLLFHQNSSALIQMFKVDEY